MENVEPDFEENISISDIVFWLKCLIEKACWAIFEIMSYIGRLFFELFIPKTMSFQGMSFSRLIDRTFSINNSITVFLWNYSKVLLDFATILFISDILLVNRKLWVVVGGCFHKTEHNQFNCLPIKFLSPQGVCSNNALLCNNSFRSIKPEAH